MPPTEPFVTDRGKNVVDGLFAIAGAITHLAEAHNNATEASLEIAQAQAQLQMQEQDITPAQTATPVAPDPFFSQSGECAATWNDATGFTVREPSGILYDSYVPAKQVGDTLRICQNAQVPEDEPEVTTQVDLDVADGRITIAPTQWLPNDVCAMFYTTGEAPLRLLVAHGKGVWGEYGLKDIENAGQQLVRCQTSR